METRSARGLVVLAGVVVLATGVMAGCGAVPDTSGLAGEVGRLGGAEGARAVVIRRQGERDDVGGSGPATRGTGDVGAATQPVGHDIAWWVAEGLRHDPELQVGFARVREALAEAKQARLLPNPVLNVAVRVPVDGSGLGGGVVEAGLGADLLSLVSKPGQARRADARVREACALVLVRAAEVVAGVREALVEAQSLEGEAAGLDERLAGVVRVMKVERGLHAAGETDGSQVRRLEVDRATLQAELIVVRARAQSGRLALARWVGRPSAEVGAWVLPEVLEEGPVAGDEKAWVKAALRKRAEVVALRWELSALGDAAESARWGLLDGAEVGAVAERDGIEGGDWTVGPAVSVPLPVFDWGDARKEGAEARRVAARHRMTQVRRGIIEEVRRAGAVYQAAVEAQGQVERELLPVLEERLVWARAAYEAGDRDATTVWMAEQELAAGKLKAMEVRREVLLTRLRLERAVGGAV